MSGVEASTAERAGVSECPGGQSVMPNRGTHWGSLLVGPLFDCPVRTGVVPQQARPFLDRDAAGAPCLPSRGGLPMASAGMFWHHLTMAQPEGQGSASVAPLRVRFRGVFDIEPGDSLTFGRSPSCDLCLEDSPDPDRNGISRLAGYFEIVGGFWRVVCKGSHLVIIDDHRNVATILKDRFAVVNQSQLTVVVEGSVRRHALQVEYPDALLRVDDDRHKEALDGSLTPEMPAIRLTNRQHLAVVALFEPLIRHPSLRSPPASYQEAAARLGQVSARSIEHRVTEVRRKAVAANVPGLDRKHGLDADSAKEALFQ